jgi:hypothetical protein
MPRREIGWILSERSSHPRNTAIIGIRKLDSDRTITSSSLRAYPRTLCCFDVC